MSSERGIYGVRRLTRPRGRRRTIASVSSDADPSAARGRAARAGSPRSGHAAWAPAPDRPDVVDVLDAQARLRVPELVPIRHGRMLESPFAFFRGGAAIMAADLAMTPVSGLRAQLCGDAHLANFGVFSAPDRRLVFDLNDFDETAPGPWEWDVKRFAASIAVAGRDRGFSADARAAAIRDGVGSYRRAIREFAAMNTLDVWYARMDADAVLEQLDGAGRKGLEEGLERARRKTSARAMRKLTVEVDGVPRIRHDPPLIMPLEELIGGRDPGPVRAQLAASMEAYRRSLAPDVCHLVSGYRAVDMAQKVVGVGSVGLRAWIVLMLGREGGDPLVLQLKEAAPAAAAGASRPRASANQGRRVVEGQRLMQAAGDVFLGWLRVTTDLDGRTRDYHVRQLWDAKWSVPIETVSAEGMATYARACGWTLARAHARSGDRAAIAGYLGHGDGFDRALVTFAERYADRNAADYAAFATAVRDGRLEAEPGR